MPDFAQPYRLLHNETIEAGFAGRQERADVERANGLLKSYRRKMKSFYRKLRSIVGGYFSTAPPQESAAGLFDCVIATCGTLANATMEMVSKFGVTLFGRYRCHTVLVKD